MLTKENLKLKINFIVKTKRMFQLDIKNQYKNKTYLKTNNKKDKRVENPWIVIIIKR